MGRVEVKNVNHPGSVKLVDSDMYKAMKRAYLAVLPASVPDLTLAQIHERLNARLPQNLYPGHTKAGWWARPFSLTWRQGDHQAGEDQSSASASRVSGRPDQFAATSVDVDAATPVS